MNPLVDESQILFQTRQLAEAIHCLDELAIASPLDPKVCVILAPVLPLSPHLPLFTYSP